MTRAREWRTRTTVAIIAAVWMSGAAGWREAGASGDQVLATFADSGVVVTSGDVPSTRVTPTEPAAGASTAPIADSATVGSLGYRLVRATFVTRTAALPVAEPSGVVVDAFGRVWMSDGALHKLVRFTPAGERLDETGALGSEPGQFRRPGALARVGSLGVAVLDVENRRVTVYDHQLRLIGTPIDLAAPELEARIGRVTPVGLASDRGGALYVADAERDRILVFDFAGAYQREIGGFGARAGGFAGLLAVSAGARGTLVTVERPRGRAKRAAADSLTGRSRVQWLDAGSRVVNSVWLPAWSAGASESGVALVVQESGQVAVSGERSGEMYVLAPDGTVLAHTRGLLAPRALAFDEVGDLYVAAAGEARLLRFTLVPPAAE